MSAAKKMKEDVRHTSVLFTGNVKSLNSAFCISKTTKPISTQFISFLPYIRIHFFMYQKIALTFLEISVPENC